MDLRFKSDDAGLRGSRSVRNDILRTSIAAGFECLAQSYRGEGSVIVAPVRHEKLLNRENAGQEDGFAATYALLRPPTRLRIPVPDV